MEIIQELKHNNINHEILIIDDGSDDNTKDVVSSVIQKHSSVRYIRNNGQNGFGRAVRLGLDEFTGDAVAIMMADQSDSPRDLVKYWKTIQDGDDVYLEVGS